MLVSGVRGSSFPGYSARLVDANALYCLLLLLLPHRFCAISWLSLLSLPFLFLLFFSYSSWPRFHAWTVLVSRQAVITSYAPMLDALITCHLRAMLARNYRPIFRFNAAPSILLLLLPCRPASSAFVQYKCAVLRVPTDWAI